MSRPTNTSRQPQVSPASVTGLVDGLGEGTGAEGEALVWLHTCCGWNQSRGPPAQHNDHLSFRQGVPGLASIHGQVHPEDYILNPAPHTGSLHIAKKMHPTDGPGKQPGDLGS